MNLPYPICYIDRATGQLKEERIYAAGFLEWSYNTRFGRWWTDLVFRRKFVSQIYGWLHRSRWSRRKIKRFVDQLKINMGESLIPVDDFKSFDEFFTREIDLTKRPIDPDPRICVAPADGRVMAFPAISLDMPFRIKRSRFDLQSFLGNRTLAREFDGGSMVVSRLYLSDYHHFHFPDYGVPSPARPVPGVYYAVSPYGRQKHVPFYSENYRMVTEFESDHFGLVAMVEIGAFTVGSIKQRYRPGSRVGKGDRKGHFELGGSTLVLLFRKGMIKLDQDLCRNTQKELETYVHLGESIGVAT